MTIIGMAAIFVVCMGYWFFLVHWALSRSIRSGISTGLKIRLLAGFDGGFVDAAVGGVDEQFVACTRQSPPPRQATWSEHAPHDKRLTDGRANHRYLSAEPAEPDPFDARQLPASRHQPNPAPRCDQRADEPGMTSATEIMICNQPVKSCIRENRVFEIPNVIETSRGIGDAVAGLVDSAVVPQWIHHEADGCGVAQQPEKLERVLAAEGGPYGADRT